MKKNQKKLQLNNNDDAPVTKGDLQRAKKDLQVVKNDLQKEMKAMDKGIREDMKVELARLLALTRLDREEQTKEIIDTIKEMMKQQRSQFYDYVDGFMKEIRNAETERTIVAGQLSENRDKLDNHEFRINTLEKKMKPPLLHASE